MKTFPKMTPWRTGGSLFICLFLVLALSGCGPGLGKKEGLENETQTWRFRYKPGVVQEAAAKVLRTKGFDIDVSDPQEGRLVTEYLRSKNIRDRVIMNFRAQEPNFTRVTCFIEREQKGLLSDEWSPREKIDPEMYRDLKNDLEYYIYRYIYDRY